MKHPAGAETCVAKYRALIPAESPGALDSSASSLLPCTGKSARRRCVDPSSATSTDMVAGSTAPASAFCGDTGSAGAPWSSAEPVLSVVSESSEMPGSGCPSTDSVPSAGPSGPNTRPTVRAVRILCRVRGSRAAQWRAQRRRRRGETQPLRTSSPSPPEPCRHRQPPLTIGSSSRAPLSVPVTPHPRHGVSVALRLPPAQHP